MKNLVLTSIIFMMFLTLSPSVYSNPNAVINLKAKFDKQFKLINPDEYLLRTALKAYLDKRYSLAFDNFKKSAAFGNSDAQMYIGLMYIKSLGVSQDWSKGYAWLSLASLDNKKKHVDIKNIIQTNLKPEEIKQAQIEFENINKDYNASTTLKRRYRWTRKQKLNATGSHTGSLSMIGRLQSQDLRGTVVTPSNQGNRYEQMNSFVDDFNFGYVTGGEIIPQDDKNNSTDTLK